MKNSFLEFLRRGLLACGFGPLILVVVYLLFKKHAGIESLTVDQVCIGIVSLSALAFVAGGMNVIYQIEQFPLMLSILIHGGVLYICYLITYLVNGWLHRGLGPILVFTVIFVLGYLAIWAVIYFITKKKTDEINEILKKKQSGMR